MGTITRGLANNVTTAGRIAASGISNSSVTSVTSFAGITGGDGSFTRLGTTTVSSSTASVTLTGMDSTYKLYLIDYAGVAPVTDSVHLQCKFSSEPLPCLVIFPRVVPPSTFSLVHCVGPSCEVLPSSLLT